MSTPAARTPAASETNFGAVEHVFPESDKRNLKRKSAWLGIKAACLHKGLFHVRVPVLKKQAAEKNKKLHQASSGKVVSISRMPNL